MSSNQAKENPTHESDGSTVGQKSNANLKTINRLRSLAQWMDSAFKIPGTSRTIGLDSLIGLIPGIGDAITGIVSAEFVRQAIKMGARKRTILKMTGNILLDLFLGSVPLLGDIFDFAFKANTKNIALLQRELESNAKNTATSNSGVH